MDAVVKATQTGAITIIGMWPGCSLEFEQNHGTVLDVFKRLSRLETEYKWCPYNEGMKPKAHTYPWHAQ